MKVLGEIGKGSPMATFDVHCSTIKTEDGHVVADAWAVESSNDDSAKETKVVAHAKGMRFTRLRSNSLRRLLASANSAGHSKQPTRPTITIPPSTFSADDFFTRSLPDSRPNVCQNPTPLLPSPTTSTDTAVGGASLPSSPAIASGIEHRLLKLVADICEVSVAAISAETKLAYLGIDSLMWIEILGRLKHIAPDIKIAPGTVTPKTFADLLAMVKEAIPSQTVNALRSPTWLRSQSDHRHDYFSSRSGLGLSVKPCRYEADFTLPPIPESDSASCVRNVQSCASSRAEPLILVHDGSGSASHYSRLSSLGRDVWAIENPKLFTGKAWKGGIEEMAKFYVEQMLNEITELRRGCILGGWSFGGVVAFHMASLLREANIEVRGLLLIDSPSPLTAEALPDGLIETVFSKARKGAMGGSVATGLVELAKIQMKNSSRALVSYKPYDYPIDRTLNAVMIRCSEPFTGSFTGNICDTDGKPTWKSVPFLDHRENPRDMVADWELLLDHTVPILDHKGNHFEVFEERNVHNLSEELLKAMTILQNHTTAEMNECQGR